MILVPELCGSLYPLPSFSKNAWNLYNFVCVVLRVWRGKHAIIIQNHDAELLFPMVHYGWLYLTFPLPTPHPTPSPPSLPLGVSILLAQLFCLLCAEGAWQQDEWRQAQVHFERLCCSRMCSQQGGTRFLTAGWKDWPMNKVKIYLSVMEAESTNPFL